VLKIAVIQFGCSDDKEKNIEKALNLWEMAAEKGAKIVCFQELFNTNWFPMEPDTKNLELAEEIPGHTTDIFSKKSKEKGIVTICPLFEKGKNGNYYNSAAIIDNYGKILGTYRKNHLPQIPLWEEKFYFKPGDLGFPVFNTDFAPIGIQMCWDNFFPEGTRIMALKGAKIIFSPTACAFASHEKWEKMISGNAIANQLFIARANRVGSEKKQDFYGKCFCVNPNGELIAGPTALNDGILFADIDLEEMKDVREKWGFFKDRRRTIYGEIVKLDMESP
jgi:N-carbamoylputrescine amidase